MISNYVNVRKNRIKLYSSLYGTLQSIGLPYGYTKKLPKNYKSLLAKGKVAAAAILKVNKVVYSVATVASGVLLSGLSVRLT